MAVTLPLEMPLDARPVRLHALPGLDVARYRRARLHRLAARL